MKHLITALVATALFISSAAVRADQGGMPPPPLDNPAAFQAMEQAHAKVEQLHSQARLAVLNVLSPAQRATLAQVVGQLSIAPTPDEAGAARQIDVMLSPAQAKNVLSIAASFHQQAHQLMETAHKQMMGSMPAGAQMHGQVFMKSMHPGSEQELNDAGTVLLMMGSHGSGMHEFHDIRYIHTGAGTGH